MLARLGDMHHVVQYFIFCLPLIEMDVDILPATYGLDRMNENLIVV